MTTPANRHYSFLFTDVEGSTRLWNRAPEAMAAAVARQEAVLREVIGRCGGSVFKTVGDGIYAVFDTPEAAVYAAVSAQQAMLDEPWPAFRHGERFSVRVAVHTGAAEARDGDYFGPTLNRLSRTLAAGHGSQVLCTAETRSAAGERWPDGIGIRDLGERTLRDVPGSGRIYQLLAPGLPDSFPPLGTLDPRTHNLPRWPTSIIGREDDAARLRALVREDGVRLVTVMGMGGVGKTRLTCEVAAELLDEFHDGVRFVDLSAVWNESGVVAACVDATGATDLVLSPADALMDWLRTREVLLLLDNCEQVADRVAALAHDIIERAPGVVILATSRVPLQIRGEHRLTLEPLPVEPASGLPISAVQLFLERAEEFGGHIDPDRSADHIAGICRVVDGLPLAIELAAAWVRVLSPEALRSRLEASRGLLRANVRDLPDRQRTLTDTLAWSYDLLHPEDQRALRRLAVFRGGFDADAATAVIQDGPAVDDFWTLARLDALVQAHLLRVSADAAGEPRFGMLQTIQEFAADTLHQSGEWFEASIAHADYFRRLVGDAQPHGSSAAAGEWFARLDREIANIGVAIEFDASIPDRRELGLRQVLALAAYLDARSTAMQERRWLDLTYDEHAPYEAWLRVEALLRIGHTWYSDPAVAGEYYARAMRLAAEVGDEERRIRAIGSSSSVAAIGGDYDTALAMAREIVAFGDATADAEYLAQGHYRVAYVACEAGWTDLALSAAHASRQAAQRSGNPVREAWSWVVEARAQSLRGEMAAVESALARATAYFADVGDDEAMALCRLEQGMASLDRDHVAARDSLRGAARVLVDTVDAYTLIVTLEAWGRWLIDDGDDAGGVRAIGAAERLRERTGIVMTRHDRVAVRRALDQAIDRSGEQRAAAWLDDGRTVPPRQALRAFLASGEPSRLDAPAGSAGFAC